MSAQTYTAQQLIAQRNKPGVAGSLDMPFSMLAARVEAVLELHSEFRVYAARDSVCDE